MHVFAQLEGHLLGDAEARHLGARAHCSCLLPARGNELPHALGDCGVGGGEEEAR